jgi:uncharacterized cupin superfamily protein
VTLIHWDEVPFHEIPESVRPLGGRWQYLGDAAGSVRVGARRLLLEPGQLSTPPHSHAAEEEIFHVLSGSATLWQGGKTCAVRASDTIVHAAGGDAHALVGGDDGLEVLTFGQRRDPSVLYLPRTRLMRLADESVLVHDDHPWTVEARLGLPEGEEAERPPNVVHLDDLEGDYGGIVKHPGKEAGAKQTGLNWIGAPPNDEGAPPHCHSLEEEVFVVLDGEGLLELWAPPKPGATPAIEPMERHPVRRGSVIARPPGTRISHCFKAGDRGLTYLAYGTRESGDICYYPRSNKIFFRGLGLIARLEALDYSDGEPS